MRSVTKVRTPGLITSIEFLRLASGECSEISHATKARIYPHSPKFGEGNLISRSSQSRTNESNLWARGLVTPPFESCAGRSHPGTVNICEVLSVSRIRCGALYCSVFNLNI